MTINKSIIVYLISIILNLSVYANEPVIAHKGMVVTADSIASQVGINILKSGGNAIDAAVAVGFALAVVYPNAGNLGGGGFMVIRNKKGAIFSLDYREKAPIKANRDMYIDLASGNVIKNASTLGYLAAGVPGTVHGLWNSHQRFGDMEWSDLLKPAIDLAEKGFILSHKKVDLFLRYKDRFSLFPSTKKIFLKNGSIPFVAGDIFIQKDLAESLKRISEKGLEGFYTGKTAILFEKDFKKNNGIITRKDLHAYESLWRDPIKISYHGYSIYSMSLPSSGGIVLAEILNSLELLDIHRFTPNSDELIRRWVEIERYAYRDRALLLGDSDFIDVPISLLISKEYVRKFITNIDFSTAGNSNNLINYNNFQKESEETTHYSIIDKWGNAVSNTYTLNGNFGSGVVVEGTGILINNEMDDFSIKAGHPNMFGLTGNEANSIQPEKRMLSSMTPVIITKNDSLFMVVGSPGGSTIITAVAQVISNVIDHQMNIREAIEAPRFHHQWQPDLIYFERNFPAKNIELLPKIGYNVKLRNKIGRVESILLNTRGELTGWSDPRGNGMAIGLN